MIKPILLWPSPILKKKSVPVFDKEFGTAELNQLVTDMWDTLFDSGGVGLAAIQIGVAKRVFVMDIGTNSVVFCNPKIVDLQGGREFVNEGCLSLPGIIEHMLRAPSVTVNAQDDDGAEFEGTYTGLEGQCVQHENDHLDGIMMPDKMTATQLAKLKKKFKVKK